MQELEVVEKVESNITTSGPNSSTTNKDDVINDVEIEEIEVTPTLDKVLENDESKEEYLEKIDERIMTIDDFLDNLYI